MNLNKTRLAKRLGYEFQNKELLELALTHRSCGAKNNERLEFLGDSIVNFIIAEQLYQRFPDAREGQLSRLRAQLVKGTTLAELAKEFEVGGCLNLGTGEMKSGGHRRESILADTLEALIGAIFLDSGFAVCEAKVQQWFEPRLDNLTLQDTLKDHKTRLQEFLQSRQLELPVYEVLEVGGQAHEQWFKVACRIATLSEPCLGEGSSRRGAEQDAARVALVALNIEKSK